jgi:hypothetical protein
VAQCTVVQCVWDGIACGWWVVRRECVRKLFVVRHKRAGREQSSRFREEGGLERYQGRSNQNAQIQTRATDDGRMRTSESERVVSRVTRSGLRAVSSD